jgi:hypothetical protein
VSAPKTLTCEVCQTRFTRAKVASGRRHCCSKKCVCELAARARRKDFEIPKPGAAEGTLEFLCGAVIDAEDYALVAQYHWHRLQKEHICYATSDGKKGADGKRTTVPMHRLITSAATDCEVDHHDGNGLNNRRANLRVCSPSQNRMNTRRRKPGMKGAYWDRRYKRWVSCIRSGEVVNGRRKLVSLGVFKTEEEAAEAYAKAAKKAFGEFAQTERAGVAQ